MIGRNVSEKHGRPGRPVLSRGTSWLLHSKARGARTVLAYGGAKSGGKGELTLRASTSTVGGFQLVIVFLSTEEVVG